MNPATSIVAVLSITLICGASAYAQDPTAAAPALALKGYDTVSYFKNNGPVKGLPEFRHDWDGVRYQFSSAQYKAAFTADPDRYTPQFAALCATGVSMGKKVEADPNVWKIVDGKLYVFSSTKAREMAEKDPAVLDRSRELWPRLK